MPDELRILYLLLAAVIVAPAAFAIIRRWLSGRDR